MFRGDPAHIGVYAAPAITHAPTVKWRFHTEGHIISSAAIADGVVYVGSTDGNLYAIDAQSGLQKWKFKTGARIASSPAVAGGLVLFESYDGGFYALDAASGSQVWKFETLGERRFSAPHIHGALPATEVMPDPFDFYLSSPAIWNDAVLFGSGDGNVYSLDRKTGALRWKFETGNVVHASPAVADGTLYIGSWDHFFYALDTETGRVKWKFKTGIDDKIHNQEGIQSSAVVANGIVYFGCRDSNLYALDAQTGKTVWTYNNSGSWVIGSPAVAGNVIYWTTSDSALFHASDAKSGRDRFTLEFKHWPMFSSPAIVGDMVYIGSHTGRLYAIDTKAGALSWAFSTDESKANLSAVSNADGTPNYRAVMKENFYDSIVYGVGRMMETGAILASPVVAPDGTIVFGSMDGNVYALKHGDLE